jgi:hypothetical protein
VKGWERVLRELEGAVLFNARPGPRTYVLTPSQQVAVMREAQRLDFAYGNTKLSNRAITREMVADAADRIDGIVRSDT